MKCKQSEPKTQTMPTGKRVVWEICRAAAQGSILLGCAFAIGTDIAVTQIPTRAGTEVSQSRNADRLLQQGLERYEAEQFAAAVNLWQQAAAAFSIQQERLGESLALNYLALAHQQLGQWQEAESAIADSLERLPDERASTDAQTRLEVLARALNTQGQLQWSRGQTETALTTWQEAARYYAEANDIEGIAIAKINQAKALQTLGLSLQSRAVLQEVYENLARLRDPALKATGLRDLGNAFRRVGELETARTILEEGRSLATEAGNQDPILLELGNVERALGERAIAIGKREKARQHFDAALHLYQQASGQPQARLNQLSDSPNIHLF